MNGGEISVHSDGENLGSTFSFTMQMKLVELGDSKEEVKIELEEKPDLNFAKARSDEAVKADISIMGEIDDPLLE